MFPDGAVRLPQSGEMWLPYRRGRERNEAADRRSLTDDVLLPSSNEARLVSFDPTAWLAHREDHVLAPPPPRRWKWVMFWMAWVSVTARIGVRSARQGPDHPATNNGGVR